MSVGFGIIGCGMIARFHARAIQEIPKAKLVACFNHRPEKGIAFAEEFGCQPYGKLEEMLARKDIQIVTICTPSGAHLEPALLAAKAGKHIIIEKPLEVTTRRCDRLIAACEKHGVKLGTIFPSRFHESAQLLKRAIDQQRFGKLVLGDAYVKWYRTQQYYDSGAWRGTWALDGGGALMNQAIHSVDLLLWLMGPVVEVYAQTMTVAHERIEVEDCAVATLKFANGAMGVIEATTAAYPGALKRIEIAGDQGSVVLQEESLIQWDFAKSLKTDDKIREVMKNRTTTGGGAADPAAIGHHAHRALFQDFLKALRTKGVAMIEGAEGRKSVALIQAIYESAKRKKPIQLPITPSV